MRGPDDHGGLHYDFGTLRLPYWEYDPATPLARLLVTEEGTPPTAYAPGRSLAMLKAVSPIELVKRRHLLQVRLGRAPSVAEVQADYPEALRSFDRALSIARGHGDEALERRTLANAAWVDVWHFRPYDCLEKGLRAIDLAVRAGDDEIEVPAHRAVIWALMASGEREQIRAHAQAESALAQRVRDRWSLASAAFDNAQLACGLFEFTKELT